MTGDMQGMPFGAISASPDDPAQADTAQRELRVRPLMTYGTHRHSDARASWTLSVLADTERRPATWRA